MVRRLLAADPGLVHQAAPHPFWGGTPHAIHVAAEWGRLDVVRALLDAGADPDVAGPGYDGWSPLLIATSRANDALVRLLLDRGAMVDAWAAAALGDVARLRQLLDANPSIAAARGPNDATPLHFAASEEVVRLLVDAGADLSARDKYGSTPLRSAAHGGRRRRPAARCLLALAGGADVFIATALGDIDRLRRLLAADPSLVRATDPSENGATARGATPLHVAASVGEADAARLLLDLGADPNARSSAGHAPLHYAAMGGHLAVAELLLRHGADPAAVDGEHHATPAGWAEFFERTELVELLRPAHS